ncbi:MAG: glycoside hydrolase family 127 protein, partial [Puniceicoccales bacterium]|nr:glycoside hydrolase family 127 protein [Puniceicoccales bacterium]
MAATVGPAPGRVPVSDLAGGPLGIERVASSFGTPIPYESGKPKDGQPLWVQIDLGGAFPVDAVKLYPFWHEQNCTVASHNFPIRFRIEAADEAAFTAPRLIADHTGSDFQQSAPLKIETFTPPAPVKARYVRLTVEKPAQFFLWRFEVLSGDKDIAQDKTLSDSTRGDLGKHKLLRPQRPHGEGVVFDHPEQVTAPETWNPVDAPLRTPRGDVAIGGLFKQAFDRNIRYLLESFDVDDVVYNFRTRDGQTVPPPRRFRKGDFWTDILGGSNAGRFLMGAGNTLRWRPGNDGTEELGKRVNAVVDVIAEHARPDGYLYGFPERRILSPDQDAYTRSWIIQGLIEAGRSGNRKVWPLLRAQGDWFNTSPYLPELFLRIKLGSQGVIANSRTYADTPIGVPADIQVLQRHFQPQFWLDQLTARDPAAIWQYPYERTHSYLIVALWTYMDMYNATGDAKYLNAALGAWDIIHDHFLHTGGSISICESWAYPFHQYPPDSRLLRTTTGEFCGNAFWISFNQLLRNLYPGGEKYAAEIEKSLYNVVLPNQTENGNIRYHARLLGKKENGNRSNTCCEGQGTRIYGTLPEFIYKLENWTRVSPDRRAVEALSGPDHTSIAAGVYVDLFTASSIVWEQKGNVELLQLQQETNFPASPEVRLKVRHYGTTVNNARVIFENEVSRHPPPTKLHIRVPAWATAPMDIFVNGTKAATGIAGTYVTLSPVKAGDEITFTLPAGFRLTKYAGQERDFSGRETYALEYGPVLMAAVGKGVKDGVLNLPVKSSELVSRLRAVADKPL